MIVNFIELLILIRNMFKCVSLCSKQHLHINILTFDPMLLFSNVGSLQKCERILRHPNIQTNEVPTNDTIHLNLVQFKCQTNNFQMLLLTI